ncbi:hypothetical protein D3C85_1305150 [compost metagenome]
MSDTGSRQDPVFLDLDEPPQELPLMVTRHTLRSRGLAKVLLEQLSASASTDEQQGRVTIKCQSEP